MADDVARGAGEVVMRENCIYRRLARCMAMLPATSAEMADATGMRQDTIRDWMRWLRADGVVAPSGRTRNDGIVWAHGTGKGFQMSGQQATASIKNFVKLWGLLTRRRTVAEITDAMSIGRRSANHMVKCLHVEGAARIAGWQMSGQTLEAYYDRLPAADVPRPAKLPRESSNARYWAKRRDAMIERGLSTRDKLPVDLRTRPAANVGREAA